MLGIEQVLPPVRMAMPEMVILPLRLSEPVARELGLRDGEVVQAAVESSAGNLRIVLHGIGIDTPKGQGLAVGDRLTFRVARQPEGALLLPLPAMPGMNPAPPATAQMPAAPAALLALLLRPPDSAALTGLVGSGRLAEMLTAYLPALATLVQTRMPSMARLDAGALRAAFAQAGLWGEALLATGKAPAQHDLKQQLQRLLNSLDESNPRRPALERALDDVHAMQLQAVQAQSRQEVLLNLLIPFVDAPPVRLTLERPAPTREQPEPPFTVNLHTQGKTLGEVWLRTGISGNATIDMTMWAERPTVAAAARRASVRLANDLHAAGLRMTSFVVHDGSRPESACSPPPGAIINLTA